MVGVTLLANSICKSQMALRKNLYLKEQKPITGQHRFSFTALGSSRCWPQADRGVLVQTEDWPNEVQQLLNQLLVLTKQNKTKQTTHTHKKTPHQHHKPPTTVKKRHWSVVWHWKHTGRRTYTRSSNDSVYPRTHSWHWADYRGKEADQKKFISPRASHWSYRKIASLACKENGFFAPSELT